MNQIAKDRFEEISRRMTRESEVYSPSYMVNYLLLMEILKEICEIRSMVEDIDDIL